MTDVDEYLKQLKEPEKSQLQRIRSIVNKAFPDAVEIISYGMPGFKYKNKYLCGFNNFKDHMSFFPTSKPIEELKENLKNYKISKGTIQFKPDNPLPEKLIKDLLKIRVKDIKR